MSQSYTVKEIIKAKFKAASVHALFTALVFSVSALLIFLVWYPRGMASLAGGLGIYKIILGVEVCLGPLMSLVIFNPAKPVRELIRDYSIVSAVQVAALFYGLYTSFVARPVYIVFVLDRLEVVRAVELEEEELLEAKSQFANLPLFGPETICVEMPADAEERSDLIFSGLAGKDIHLIPKYYRPCQPGEIYEHGESLELLRENIKKRGEKLPAIMSAKSETDLKWLPINSRFGDQAALISGDRIVSYVDTDPFF